MTIEQLIQENAMLRQHIVDNQLAMPEEIQSTQALHTDSEPVAEITSANHDDAEYGERSIRILRDFQHLDYGTKLYAAPPVLAAPAAVAVPDEREAFERWQGDTLGRDLQELSMHASGDYDCVDIQSEWEAWQAGRALVHQVLRDLPDGAPGFAIPAPQAQADARDAERWRAAREEPHLQIEASHLFGKPIRTAPEFDEVVDAYIKDAAIAAAKGE